jgi:hypothetical protein
MIPRKVESKRLDRRRAADLREHIRVPEERPRDRDRRNPIALGDGMRIVERPAELGFDCLDVEIISGGDIEDRGQPVLCDGPRLLADGGNHTRCRVLAHETPLP